MPTCSYWLSGLHKWICNYFQFGGWLLKTFIIQERFTGYADIHIDAETEEEAIALYNRGHYKDSQYFMDDFFYNYEFDSISEMEAA